jgi:hypothetical protein
MDQTDQADTDGLELSDLAPQRLGMLRTRDGIAVIDFHKKQQLNS